LLTFELALSLQKTLSLEAILTDCEGGIIPGWVIKVVFGFLRVSIDFEIFVGVAIGFEGAPARPQQRWAVDVGRDMVDDSI
jgi:hypothetical protein